MFPSSIVGERAGIWTLTGATPTGKKQNRIYIRKDLIRTGEWMGFDKEGNKQLKYWMEC